MSNFLTALVLLMFACPLFQESQGAPSAICHPNECLAPVDYSQHKVEFYHKGVALSRLPGRRCYKSLTATCTDPVKFMMKDTDNVKSWPIDCDAQAQRWNIPTCIKIRDKDENLGNPKCKTKPLDRKIRFKTKYGRLTKGLFSTGTVLEFRCKDGHRLSDNEGRVCFEDGWSHNDFPRCSPTPTSIENMKQDAAIAHQDMNSKRVPRRAHVGGRPVVGKRSTVYCPKANGCRPECKDPWIRNGYISGRAERPHIEGSMVHITCMDGFIFVNSHNKDGRIYCNGLGKWSLTPEDVCVASGCRHPGNIDKGYIHFSREQVGTTQIFPFGTDAKYGCDVHHTLIGGESTRTCKPSGNGPYGVWSPDGSPVCMWVAKSWGW